MQAPRDQQDATGKSGNSGCSKIFHPPGQNGKALNLKSIHGQSVPLQRHWACTHHLPPDKVDKREVVDTQPPINIGSTTIEEIHEALRSSKIDKAPGPDGLTIELYKLQISRRRQPEVAGENLEPNVD